MSFPLVPELLRQEACFTVWCENSVDPLTVGVTARYSQGPVQPRSAIANGQGYGQQGQGQGQRQDLGYSGPSLYRTLAIADRNQCWHVCINIKPFLYNKYHVSSTGHQLPICVIQIYCQHLISCIFQLQVQQQFNGCYFLGRWNLWAGVDLIFQFSDLSVMV